MEDPGGSDEDQARSASEPSSPTSSGEVAVIELSDNSDSDGNTEEEEEQEEPDSSPDKVTRCVAGITGEKLRAVTYWSGTGSKSSSAVPSMQRQATARAQARTSSNARSAQHQGSCRRC